MWMGDHRHYALKKLLGGALLLLNAWVWPRWLGVDGWVAFVALLMVLNGFLMLVWHSRDCCSEKELPVPKKPAKRRKR